MAYRSAGESDLVRSVGQITGLYRSLAVAIVSVEAFSSDEAAELRQADQIAARIRVVCSELEHLWAVVEEGDEDVRANVPRRIGVLEREIQTLLGQARSLGAGRVNRVDTGWKR